MKTLKYSMLVVIMLFSMMFLIAAPGGGSGSDPKCQAGGPGASTCSIEFGIPGVGGGTSCSVSCTSGYACCWFDVLLNARCTCRNSSSGGSPPGS